MIYFASDTHFNHANILNYCPWRKKWARDVSEMDRVLTDEWNKVVKSDDIVYHLGDFAFGTEEQIKTQRLKLNGDIYLALGNHDRSRSLMIRCGLETEHHHLLSHHVDTGSFTGVYNVAMVHDPSRFYDHEIVQADLLLHGHLHGEPYPDSRAWRIAKHKLIDVGVDALKRTRPISIDELLTLFKEKQHV